MQYVAKARERAAHFPFLKHRAALQKIKSNSDTIPLVL